MMRDRFVTGLLFVLVAGILSAPAGAQTAGPPALGLVHGTNSLVRFDVTAPGTLGATIPITGLGAGETLKAIDYRPANGTLYGVTTDGTNAVHLYSINPTTGAATSVGASVTLPTTGTSWDISFNPVVDRIRIVNDQDENARLVPDTGALAADDTNLTPPAATVDSIAYTNPVAGATTTTLYALNQATNSLATIGGIGGTPSPNGGVVTDVGPLGVTFAGSSNAIDIATNNTAYAVIRPVNGVTSVYTVSLTTGAATLVGALGDGTLAIDDIAMVDPSLTISPPTGTYTSRQNFDLVFLADAPGRTVVTGSASFDGLDVTSVVAGCVRSGVASGGVVSFRCPNVGGPAVGAGMHTFQVRLVMNDGSVVQRSVTWTVVAVTEP